MNCNYKVNIKDIQNKYKFNIFAMGGYNDSDLRKMIESVYYALPRVNGSGTSVTLNDTAFSYMKNKLYATDTSQSGTPTPDTPIPINVVSGDNEVVVCWKNLFVKSSVIEDEKYLDNGTISTDSSYCRSPLYMNVNGVSNLTISGSNSSSNGKVIIYDENKNVIDYWSTRDRTITIPNNSYYIRISVEKAYKDTLQVEVGTIATSYSSDSQTYEVDLGELELCKIGNYEDKIFKAIKGNEIYDSLASEEKATLDYGKWYLRKATGKVVLNGSETWFNDALSSTVYRFSTNTYTLNSIPYTYGKEDGYSNYFKYLMQYSGSLDVERIYTNANNIICITSVATTNNDFKNWLSTHNTIVYYVLATPVNELFNDTIQDQLEDIYNNMLSYEGQTNVSQVNEDLPFNINSTALKDLNNL